MKLVLGLLMVWMGAVSLSAQFTLQIEVVDENNGPLPGAFGTIQDSDKSTLSNEMGLLTFNGLDAGDYSITITHIGFETKAVFIELERDKFIQVRMASQAYAFDAVELISTWVKDKTPMTYKTLGKEEIDRNNLGQDVPFLLQWTPSVVASSDAGAGIGYTGISIRGTDPTRINVTINGVPLNDSESQGVFWVNMPEFASSVDHIQIQRGAGSSTNGAGAFGATINMSTQQVRQEAYGSFSSSVGSFNTLRLNAMAGTGLINGKYSIEGRISKINSDGYVDRASSDLISYQLNAAYVGKKSSLKFNIISGREITYQAWNGLPYQFLDDPELRTFNTAGQRSDGTFYPHEVDNYRQTHYQLIHQLNPIPGLFTNLTLHYTRGYGYFEQYRNNDRLSTYKIDPIEIGGETITRTDLIRRRWLDNHFYGGILSVDYRPTGEMDQITVGIAYNEYMGDHFGEIVWARFAGESHYLDRYYFNDGFKTDFNTFIKYSRKLGKRWNLFGDLQYRRIFYRFEGDDNSGFLFNGDAVFNFFNPKAGLFFENTRGLEAYVSVATAAREPNRRDFINTSEVSRPDAEFMYNPEMGVHLRKRNYSVGANLYLMYYKDQLALTGEINDVGAYTRINVPESYRAGIELEAAAVFGDFFAGTALTFSRNKIIEFREFIDDWDTGGQIEIVHANTDLALSPNIIGNLEVGYRPGKVSLWGMNITPEITLLTKYVGKQYLDNTSNPFSRLDPYWFSDLRLRTQWMVRDKQTLTLSLWINNIFSRRYVTNGWIYRFQSLAYDPVPDDPYARREGLGRFNLTGVFPQALANWLLGVQYEF